VVLLLTDTHLGLYKSSDLWHDVTINLFKEVVDTALSREIQTIIHLGDFFNERKSTNNKTLEVAYEIAEILKTIPDTYIITGNHDIYYKNKLNPSALTMFKNFKHIHIVTEPCTLLDDSICMIPWGQEIPESVTEKYCLGHFEINNFFMNSKAKCDKAKLNASDFSSFDHVYSGHFHTPSTQGNITYLGSPFQQSFHDVGSSRGYYIFDKGDLEFIEFKDYPKFTNVKSSDILNVELIKNNIINFVFEEDYGTNKNIQLVEKIQSLSPQSLKVDFGKIPIEDNDIEMLKDIVIEGHDMILNEYINQDKNRPKGLKKKKIKQLLSEMMEEI